MTLFRRLCRAVTHATTRAGIVRTRLADVEGLEHLPADGAFVLISNHNSFSDHFIYDALLFAARGDQVAFLTKAESFSGIRGIWFDALGAVPVDRDNPLKGLLDTAGRILGSGQVLAVYPEGTRNRDPEAGMLPFKDGAFRFAERSGVPVVPAAIWASHELLPVGALVPRRSKVRVAFGPPLAGDPALPRAARIREFTERGRAAVTELVETVRSEPPDQTAALASRRTAALADAVLERSLSGTDPVPAAIRHKQAGLLVRMARLGDPANLAAGIVAVRLTGLRALASRTSFSPMRLVRVLRVRSGAARLVRRDPDQVMAHYLLGRWHLTAPRLIGGKPAKAVEHLRETERLSDGDTRYGMAHAEALVAAGRPGDAAAVLERIVSAPASDVRTRNRQARAAELLRRIEPTLARV